MPWQKRSTCAGLSTWYHTELRQALERNEGDGPPPEPSSSTPLPHPADPVRRVGLPPRDAQMLDSMAETLAGLARKYAGESNPAVCGPFIRLRNMLLQYFPVEVEQAPAIPSPASPVSLEPEDDAGTEQGGAEDGEETEAHSRCSICGLPAGTRAQIAYRLGEGASVRIVASEFGLTPSSVFRHARHSVRREG